MHAYVVFKPYCQGMWFLREKKKEMVYMVENLAKRVLCLMLIFTAMFLGECRDSVLHRVGGGRFTWAPHINFTEWSSREHFYVGDWLYFGFNKRLYDVLEVNKTSYENCIDEGCIHNVTRGGRDVFNLTEAKPYYFLSSRGYCFQGMKVAINVHDYQPPGAAPFPVYNGLPSYIGSQFIRLQFLATALVWTSLFQYV